MKKSPLLQLHSSLGARLTGFSGWDMPLQYEGIKAEHLAVRSSAGVFDVSHLGKLLVGGPDSGPALDRALTCDVQGLEVGRARYGLVLAEDAGCIDDVFVYRLGEEEWLCVPNAANVGPVSEHIAHAGCDAEDVWDRWAILALQGPDSDRVLGTVWPDSPALELKLHGFVETEIEGERGFIARTGYTGERGYEIYAPWDSAEKTFRALIDAGSTPAGLGARDTLRLEMGYALYGHEIDRSTDPLSAGLGWAVAWDTDFRGKDALAQIKRDGPPKKLFGVRLRDRGVPRQGYEVFAEGERIGEVVSGNYSPTLGTGIALAYAAAELAPSPGDGVEIEARGRRLGGDIVKPPFIEKR